MEFSTIDLDEQVADFLSRLCPTCHMYLRVGDWPICDGSGHPPSNLTVEGDEIPGGMVIENMSAQPEKFYSKSDWRRRMKELGLVQMVKHVPQPGSDKSPHTQRFV